MTSNLFYEAKVYKSLLLKGKLLDVLPRQLSSSVEGFPSLHWYGSDGTRNMMVIDLLGPSVEDLFAHYKHKFSLKTVIQLADQMVFSAQAL